jgi:GntR family transcriptional regulator
MNLSQPTVFSPTHPLPDALCYGSKSVMTQDNRPVYLRLRDIIAAAIIDGTYAEGAMLPSVRAFAVAQGANPLTVAKAYQQFQLDGLVEVQRGVGMFVVPGAAEKLRRSERAHFLAAEWPQLRDRMRRLGIEPAELLAEG